MSSPNGSLWWPCGAPVETAGVARRTGRRSPEASTDLLAWDRTSDTTESHRLAVVAQERRGEGTAGGLIPADRSISSGSSERP